MNRADKIAEVAKSFTDEQRALYDEMLGNADKLKAEWFLCRNMYQKAADIINAKTTGPEVRIILRYATTDYWNRRRLALERMLECTGHNDLLVAWRAEYNGKK